MVRCLLEFNYDVIEKGRRRQIRSMYDIVMEASALDTSEKQDKLIRSKVLAILENAEITVVRSIATADNCGFDDIMDAFTFNSTNKAIESIYGQAARALESTPDHPGLLSLSAMQMLTFSHGTFDEFIDVVKI